MNSKHPESLKSSEEDLVGTWAHLQSQTLAALQESESHWPPGDLNPLLILNSDLLLFYCALHRRMKQHYLRLCRESYEEKGPRDSPLPQQQPSQVTTGSPLYLPGSHNQASGMESSLSVSRHSGSLTRSPKPMTTCQFGACVYVYSFLRSYNPLCYSYQIPESVHKKIKKAKYY